MLCGEKGRVNGNCIEAISVERARRMTKVDEYPEGHARDKILCLYHRR